MTAVTLPFTFVNGTVIDATQVDANFNALVSAINTNTRTILTTNIVFTVANGGTDSVTGLNPAQPAATGMHCLAQLYAAYDLNGMQATIMYLPGNYNENLQVTGGFIGQFQPSQINIQGNVGNPDSVVLNGDPCLQLNHYGQCLIQGFKLTSDANDCLQSINRSDLAFQAIDFGVTSGSHIRALRGGQIRTASPYTISGSAVNHILYQQGEVYIDSGATNTVPGSPLVTLAGTPNFSGDFVSGSRTGYAQIFAAFAGTGATGFRYSVVSNAVLNTGGQPITYLPGSAPDPTPTASGGQYV